MTTENTGLQAWRAMLLAHTAAIRAIDAELTRTGRIPLSWYDVLLELNAADDGRLRMQELADRVVLSRTRVSRLVDEMAHANLVDKTRDDDDRRVVWARITEHGTREFRTAAPIYLTGIESHFSSHLTEHEKKVIAGALTKVRHAHQPTLGIPARPAH